MGTKPIVTVSSLAMGFGALLMGTALAGVTGGSAADAAVQEQPKAAQGDRSRRVCRVITPTASRLTRRVCRTQEEWDASSQRAQDGLLDHQINQATTYKQNSPG